jgi:hypothetical protein
VISSPAPSPSSSTAPATPSPTNCRYSAGNLAISSSVSLRTVVRLGHAQLSSTEPATALRSRADRYMPAALYPPLSVMMKADRWSSASWESVKEAAAPPSGEGVVAG